MRLLRTIVIASAFSLICPACSFAQTLQDGTKDSAPLSTLPSSIYSIAAGSEGHPCSGDDGPATKAALVGPSGVAVDSKGNLYIADSGDSEIRFVDSTTGRMSTIAGTCGKTGYAGDGGPAAAALLNSPSAIALDSSGNIYVADTSNCVIRKIDAKTKIISLVAGQAPLSDEPFQNCKYSGSEGLATAISLNKPQGLALDTAGNLYVADSSNGLIRRIDATTQIMSTFAGKCVIGPEQGCTGGFNDDGGLATETFLDQPMSIALDAKSNVYFADRSEALIRRVDGRTGIINIVAGHCDLIKLPSGITNCAINSSASPDGVKATEASLLLPIGVALDPFGNLIFSDSQDNLIRKVDLKTGVLTTIAGLYQWTKNNAVPANEEQLDGPAQLAFDGSGNLYIAEASKSVVSKVTGSQAPVAEAPVIIPGSEGIAQPIEVTIADDSKDATIFYTLDGSTPTTKSKIYTSPFNSAERVMAFATAPGLVNSPTTIEEYTSESRLPPPTFYPAGGSFSRSVQVFFSISGPSQIYYTLDGTTPTANSIAGGSVILSATTTIKAIAFAGYGLPSPVATATYTFNQPALPMPAISPAAGAYDNAQVVTISGTGSGISLYYTTDGSTPTIASQRYKGPISLDSSATIRAVATASGYNNSPAASASFTIHLPTLPSPTFSPSSGSYAGTTSVSLHDANPKANIFYSTDGSVPTTDSARYSKPIEVSSDTTLKAIATSKGYVDGPIAAAAYSIVTKPAAYTGDASAITADSATLTGAVNPNNASATWWFEYGTSKTSLKSATPAKILKAGTKTIDIAANINGLMSKTVYYYQIVSENSVGETSGSVLSFTTP